MQPVLFSVGSVVISSFGLFLALGVLAGIFICWRLAQFYDISAEKILDLSLLSFFGGMIGARLFYILFNLTQFDSVEKMFLINKYPGLSFWGGIFLGLLTLSFFARKSKINLFQILDFGSVGFTIGQFWGNIGCFLSGCGYGVVSSLSIATPVVGLLGKRFPIQAVEAAVFLLIFLYLWKSVVRFHFAGKIFGYFLVLEGIVKLVTESLRASVNYIPYLIGITYGQVFSIILILAGTTIYYQQSKRSIWEDLKAVISVSYSAKARKNLLTILKKSCYNQLVSLKIKAGKTKKLVVSLPKILKGKLHVKSTPTNPR